nr:MAG TPA: hypothetical protein [Caudoviricetes sp.]
MSNFQELNPRLDFLVWFLFFTSAYGFKKIGRRFSSLFFAFEFCSALAFGDSRREIFKSQFKAI